MKLKLLKLKYPTKIPTRALTIHFRETDVPKWPPKKTKAKKHWAKQTSEEVTTKDVVEESERQEQALLRIHKFPRILPLSWKYNVKTKTSDLLMLVMEHKKSIREGHPEIKLMVYIAAMHQLPRPIQRPQTTTTTTREGEESEAPGPKDKGKRPVKVKPKIKNLVIEDVVRNLLLFIFFV